MISRKAALALAAAYTDRFTSGATRNSTAKVHRDSIYDFLFENDYEAWFCNLAKSHQFIRQFKEFWLRLHTGESIVSVTKDWSWEQRRKKGQLLLRELSEDHLGWYASANSSRAWMPESYGMNAEALLRRLELDGYVFRDGVLLQQQQDVLNVEEEAGVLEQLYRRASLARSEHVFEFLRLGEEHFVQGRWSDCISNVRKFFELTLQEGARRLSTHTAQKIDGAAIERPVEVRKYLEDVGVFEKKEREAVDKLYGLLSHTGAHPYMAESDQARLLRQLSLTMVQFVLLRLEASLALSTS